MIKVKSVKQTSNCCPSEWIGETEAGATIYARYRSGNLMIGYGCDIEDAVHAAYDPNTATVYDDTDWRDGDIYASELTYRELKARTRGVINWPKVRS